MRGPGRHHVQSWGNDGLAIASDEEISDVNSRGALIFSSREGHKIARFAEMR